MVIIVLRNFMTIPLLLVLSSKFHQNKTKNRFLEPSFIFLYSDGLTITSHTSSRRNIYISYEPGLKKQNMKKTN